MPETTKKVKDRDGRLLRAKELLQSKLASKDQELEAALVCVHGGERGVYAVCLWMSLLGGPVGGGWASLSPRVVFGVSSTCGRRRFLGIGRAIIASQTAAAVSVDHKQ